MDSNLVDSASSHTLVSKIKPCMSKYKSFTLKLRTAHYAVRQSIGSLVAVEWEAILEGCRFKDMED